MKKSNLSENKVLKTDFLHILMSDYHPSNRTKKITTENHFVSFRTLQSYMLQKKGLTALQHPAFIWHRQSTKGLRTDRQFSIILQVFAH